MHNIVLSLMYILCILVSGQEDQDITNPLQFPHQPPEACLTSSAAISQVLIVQAIHFK